jgi:hypothetical protein
MELELKSVKGYSHTWKSQRTSDSYCCYLMGRLHLATLAFLESEREIRLAIAGASNDSNRQPKERDNMEVPCVYGMEMLNMSSCSFVCILIWQSNGIYLMYLLHLDETC